jgi:hypothetical protein
VLFPDFVRTHFRKEEMARFIGDNIDGFTVNGVELPCEVELFSGTRLSATLSVRAKFFTAKTSDVLHHWHMTVGRNQVDLQSRRAVPIGLDVEGAAGLRDELKKKVKEYVHAIVGEPAYAEQLTDGFRHTELPKKVLRIAQTYAKRSDVGSGRFICPHMGFHKCIC